MPAAEGNAMALIGMREAGRRAGLSERMVRLHLRRAGVPLGRLDGVRLGVEEADLAAFVASRPFGAVGAAGPPTHPLEDLPCVCPASPHHAQCPRGRAIKRRARRAERLLAGGEGTGAEARELACRPLLSGSEPAGSEPQREPTQSAQ